MWERYQDQGLVLIGVHTTRGSDQMAAYVESAGIDYPVAIDKGGETVKVFAVDSYPDYYLIDRAGNLRVADLSNGDLDRAVQVLLAEPGGAKPSGPAPAMAKACATAKKKDKRVLVVWGADKERRELDALMKATSRESLAYEFEVVRLSRGANADLARGAKAGDSGPALSAFDAGGELLATLDARRLDAELLSAFLEKTKVPTKDAEQIWRDALARAQREKKNLLVHLGAPW